MAPPSFAFDLMRTAVLSLAARHPALSSLFNPRQSSAVSYRDSPLNAVATRCSRPDRAAVRCCLNARSRSPPVASADPAT